MKRLFLLGILFCSLVSLVNSQTIIPVSTQPAEGEELSVLEEIIIDFDMSGAVESTGEDASSLGIASQLGNINKYRVLLYKETPDEELATNQNIKTNENIVASTYRQVSYTKVVPGEHSITIPFTNQVVLEPGVDYTVFIPASRFAGTTNTKNYFTTTAYREPIIIHIKGKAAEGLQLQSRVPATESVEGLNVLTLNFNKDVTVAPEAAATVICKNEEYAKSLSMTAEGSSVSIDFGELPFYKNSTYSVEIPEGAILAAETGEAYEGVSLQYSGESLKYFTTSVVTPAADGNISYLNNVSVSFGLDEGLFITKVSPTFNLYEGDVETGELIGSYTAEVNSALDGFDINIRKFDLKPNTTYTLYLKEGTFSPYRLVGGNQSINSLYTNAAVVIAYHTSADMQEFPRVTPVSAETLEGSKNTLRVVLPGYEFDGKEYAPTLNGNHLAVSIENIQYLLNNSSGSVVTHEAQYLTAQVYSGNSRVGSVRLKREGNPMSDTEIWLTGSMGKALYAGKEYRVVIPADAIIPTSELADVAGNKETTLTFEGKGEHALSIVCDNVAENSTVGELRTLTFTADETIFAPQTEPSVSVKSGDVTRNYPLTLFTTEGNTTGMQANLVDESGRGFIPETGKESSISIRANLFTSSSDPQLRNDALTVNFTAAVPDTVFVTETVTVTDTLVVKDTIEIEIPVEVEVPVEVLVKPETVNVTYMAGDYATTVFASAKDSTLTVAVVPEEGWQLEDLWLDDVDVKAEVVDGTYTTPALAADATLKAVFGYAGELTLTDINTGIAEVSGTDYAVRFDAGNLIVEGVKAGDTVEVYSLGGMKLAAHQAKEDRVVVGGLLSGQTYIVRINNKYAVKIENR
ncbi:MAG: hypothetical protein NC206_07380 [Bacteroides sp.]|nr:hypothetical protein [Roseburia sp.]MCM1346893.1 hypothetical protein [Bacteroides sp.]MCM1420628.1 hypothetical protein [Bacteroides sp.]